MPGQTRVRQSAARESCRARPNQGKAIRHGAGGLMANTIRAKRQNEISSSEAGPYDLVPPYITVVKILRIACNTSNHDHATRIPTLSYIYNTQSLHSHVHDIHSLHTSHTLMQCGMPPGAGRWRHRAYCSTYATSGMLYRTRIYSFISAKFGEMSPRR